MLNAFSINGSVNAQNAVQKCKTILGSFNPDGELRASLINSFDRSTGTPEKAKLLVFLQKYSEDLLVPFEVFKPASRTRSRIELLKEASGLWSKPSQSFDATKVRARFANLLPR